MSVMIRNKSDQQVYIFVKGAPELINSFSLMKCINFDKIVKDLSLKGFRSVAVSYKTVK